MYLYRLIMAVLLPVLLARALWRGEGRADLAERLGFVPKVRANLWLHGASNGELASARWVIEGLLAARPALRIGVTCNTLSARQMVQGWHNPRVTVALAPLDSAFATRRLLQRWQPRALISLEAELWPARIAACTAKDVPVLMLGARMSARSARGWARVPALAAAALAQVRFASAQDALSRENLARLGLPRAAIAPDFDLKAHAIASLPTPEPLPRAARAGWLLAASTHEGEDAAIVNAFAASGFAHLILAPRHPARAPAIAALLTARGLTFALRSNGAGPGTARVLLADTLGEMDRWYALCGACIVGGTLVNKGGHTPWEPIRHGCAILHGPSTANFAAAYAALDAAGAALPVTPATLPTALAPLDGPAQDRLASAAAPLLQASGDPTALLARLFTISRL